jgi:hypothetical protein
LVTFVHADIAQYGGAKDWPVWGSEWGTWEEYRYDGVPWSVDIVVENLILGSRPGDTHMDGGHVFALYDWAGNGWTYDAYQSTTQMGDKAVDGHPRATHRHPRSRRHDARGRPGRDYLGPGGPMAGHL